MNEQYIHVKFKGGGSNDLSIMIPAHHQYVRVPKTMSILWHAESEEKPLDHMEGLEEIYVRTDQVEDGYVVFILHEQENGRGNLWEDGVGGE